VPEIADTSQEIQASWQSWRDEILALGVANPLLNFEQNHHSHIDLARAHPSGISQLTGSGMSVLSNLVREPLSFSRSLATARRIYAKGHELLEHYGLSNLFIAAGLANLESDGFDLALPILLWPISLVANGDDFQIEMAGPAVANPYLIRHFEICYGVSLSAEMLERRAGSVGDLLPIAVFDYLNAELGDAGTPELSNLLVVGNFVLEPAALEADFAVSNHTMMRRLAGESDATGLPPREPARSALMIADADKTQNLIVRRTLAGHSFAVETLPGCGYTQLVANLLGALAAENRKVLVVAPRQQTLNELADRLSSFKVAGLGVRSRHAWLDTIAAISRHEKAGPHSFEAAVGSREATLGGIRDYFESLNSLDAQLGVSLADALQHLAKLSSLPKAPETTARIQAEHLALLGDRTRALALLQQAHDLGEFNYGPQDTAWYQARFESAAEVQEALEMAVRLRDEIFDQLAAELGEFITKANLRPANSVAEWGAYLELFVGLRSTLDTFVPDVFDRSLGELIEATSPKKTKGAMSGGTRRRLKKLAKEYVRAGRPVADLHQALRNAQSQNELWQAYCIAQTPPQVPGGIQQAETKYRQLLQDLTAIAKHLDPESGEPALVDLALDVLKAKLLSLAEPSPALENLGERATVMSHLRELGLAALCRDLSTLHASREQLALELELAWWQSCLERLLESDARSVALDSQAVESRESRFAEADAAVAAEAVAKLNADLATAWRSGLAAYGSEAANIKQLLRGGKASLHQILETAPNLFWSLTNTVMMSPYEVATQLPRSSFGTAFFDVVLVLDSAGSTIAENLAALVRANQVIGFGDDAISAPTGFEIEARVEPIGREIEAKSAFDRFRDVFGSEVLRSSYRHGGQALGWLVNREFYQNRILFEPTADEFLGKERSTVEIITEKNRAQVNGSAESLEVEVNRVAELVFNHALWQPQDSLLVASASAKHAVNIRAAIHDGLRSRPQLAAFFESHGSERFEVLSLADMQHRIADRVIFSVGFGRDQHGQVGTEFGQLSEPDGRRSLANLLVSARRQITTVACFSAIDLQGDSVSGAALLLRDLLTKRHNKNFNDLDRDALLADLAIRIKKLSIRTDFSFGNRLPLVASFANNAVVVMPDSAIEMDDPSYSLRLRPALLEAMGWRVLRVSSFELFADPQAVAYRVAEALGVSLRDKPLKMFDESDRAFEDTDMAWGEPSQGNDQRLRDDKPPHWG
jgi:hypothetical protein